MKAEEYNGWYNYNVWNVMLYVDNESDIYQFMNETFEDYYNGKISAKKFEQKVNQIGARAKMRSDVKKEKLTKKEIAEIRKGIKDLYKEYKRYEDSKKGS